MDFGMMLKLYGSRFRVADNGLRIREGRGTSIYFMRRYNLVLCGLD
jgi:putative component of toxin-antitoxin plasmid stabilization module